MGVNVEQQLFTSRDVQGFTAAGPWESFEGRCKCSVHDVKPDFCKNYPTRDTVLPGCGYFFEQDPEGKWVKKGACKNRGLCCSVPRRGGDPYGCYDPRGRPCKFLLIDGKLSKEVNANGVPTEPDNAGVVAHTPEVPNGMGQGDSGRTQPGRN